MGESVTEATIARWFKKEGDAVKRDEPLLELETDKVTVEVPSPAAGAIEHIASRPAARSGRRAAGRRRRKVLLRQAQQRRNRKPRNQAAQPAKAAASATAAPAANVPPPCRRPSASPRKAISMYRGRRHRQDGRVTKGDMLGALEARKGSTRAEPAPAPSGPRPRAEREERVPMTRLRKTIALRLKESQNTAAQLTTFNEVDMTAVMALRATYKDSFEKKHGVKLGFMGFFAKA